MDASWSQQVGDRFRVALPADVAAWFDEGRWELLGGAEFHRPLAPEQLLTPEGGVIWGGFMLPDTLPLIGNDYGDWLCLRFSRRNTIAELVYWTHAGGDWIPYGDTLAEALLFDAAHYARDTGNTAWAGRDEEDGPVLLHVEWAAQRLETAGRKVPRFWDSPATSSSLEQLAAAGIARCAVARDSILRHLDTRLRLKSDYRLAERLKVAWEPDFVSWMFDTNLIPPARRQQLSAHYAVPIDDLVRQDWDSAERVALDVIRDRDDLGWAFDIAGWASERRGDWSEACRRYAAGLRPSLFADNTVQFRTHWIADGFGKFAASRLYELRSYLPDSIRRDPYLALFLANDAATLRERLRDYWLAAANEAQQEMRHAEAYDAYYRAGWDLGLRRVDEYLPVLDGMIQAAQRAGFESLAALAELHRACI